MNVSCVLQIEEEKKRAARTDYWLQPVRIPLGLLTSKCAFKRMI